MLAEIVVVRRGRVRRAKLYYLRNLTGKATRIKEKKVRVPETGAPPGRVGRQWPAIGGSRSSESCARPPGR